MRSRHSWNEAARRISTPLPRETGPHRGVMAQPARTKRDNDYRSPARAAWYFRRHRRPGLSDGPSDLANRGLLPPTFSLVGFARRDWKHRISVKKWCVQRRPRALPTPFRQQN